MTPLHFRGRRANVALSRVQPVPEELGSPYLLADKAMN
jgi:hypothetical protein